MHILGHDLSLNINISCCSDRRHKRKQVISGQSDISGSLKVFDRINDQVKEGRMLSSGSRSTVEDQVIHCLIFLSQTFPIHFFVMWNVMFIFILGNICSWRKYILISNLLRTENSNYRLVVSCNCIFFTFSMAEKIPSINDHIVCDLVGFIFLEHLKYSTFLTSCPDQFSF